MAASGGRAVEGMVQQEGDGTVEEAESIASRQGSVTVLPMQLTRLAMQTNDGYQNHKNSLPTPASLQFQGLINSPPPPKINLFTH